VLLQGARVRGTLGASAQIYLAGDNALAGLRIVIDRGQTHAIAADFLDRHSGAAVAIDFLGPTDGKLDHIARAFSVQAGDARARAAVGALYAAPLVLMSAPIARERPSRPVHLPSSDSEVAVVSEANLHEMFIGEELARTLIVPFPLQLPSMDSKNSASPACAAAL
jgi:hypothetical protein